MFFEFSSAMQKLLSEFWQFSTSLISVNVFKYSHVTICFLVYSSACSLFRKYINFIFSCTLHNGDLISSVGDLVQGDLFDGDTHFYGCVFSL